MKRLLRKIRGDRQPNADEYNALIDAINSLDNFRTGPGLLSTSTPAGKILSLIRKPSPGGATSFEAAFAATDWLNSTITIIQAGAPVIPGEIGPHGLAIGQSYAVQVSEGVNIIEEIELDIVTDITTGIVTLRKGTNQPNFDGRIIMKS